jgi:uncharacterized protein
MKTSGRPICRSTALILSGAARIFQNPVLERIDDREDYGEERFIAIGHWQTDFVVVVTTWRGGNRRIISAWKAGADEQRNYQQAFA